MVTFFFFLKDGCTIRLYEKVSQNGFFFFSFMISQCTKDFEHLICPISFETLVKEWRVSFL